MVRHPDCQLYVDLHGFTPGREPVAPQDALSVLLRALDVPAGRIPDGPEERAALWRSELALRRAVVVLDNAVDGVEPLALAVLSDAEAFGQTCLEVGDRDRRGPLPLAHGW